MIKQQTISKNWSEELDKNILMWAVAKVSTEGVIESLKSFITQSLKEAYMDGKGEVIKEMTEYNKGWVKYDEESEPIFSPEFFVIQQLIDKIKNSNKL